MQTLDMPDLKLGPISSSSQNHVEDDRVTELVSAPSTPLNAQQTALVRTVIHGEGDFLCRSYRLDTATGKKVVDPLAPEEFSSFRLAWQDSPTGCISSMNEAISRLQDPQRLSRYLDAAFELELLMDHKGLAPLSREDHVGIPEYLADGYTDLGFHDSKAKRRRSREKIVVDKGRLRPQLLQSKRRAVKLLSGAPHGRHAFETVLRDCADTLRKTVGYDEMEAEGPRGECGDDTVPLSQALERGTIACRHLAILCQLWLQEAGIPSRLVKGTLMLFAKKGRHAWNVARFPGSCALLDVTFASQQGSYVVTGRTLTEVYEKANQAHRLYAPTPDSWNHYQI